MTFSWSTFALQTINFLVLVWLIKRFLYKPVAAIVAQRKAEIARTLSEAELARLKAEQARKQFEEHERQIEAQRESIVEQERTELTNERSRMIIAACADIDKLKSAAQVRLDEERERAAGELVARSVQMAIHLAETLLTRLAAPGTDELFLQRLVEHLDHLAAPERAALLAQIAGDGAQVVLTTAYPMDSHTQSRWDGLLKQHLGGTLNIAYANDPKLIAGAELKFPHAAIRFSWRDSLGDAQRELNQDEHTD